MAAFLADVVLTTSSILSARDVLPKGCDEAALDHRSIAAASPCSLIGGITAPPALISATCLKTPPGTPPTPYQAEIAQGVWRHCSI